MSEHIADVATIVRVSGNYTDAKLISQYFGHGIGSRNGVCTGWYGTLCQVNYFPTYPGLYPGGFLYPLSATTTRFNAATPHATKKLMTCSRSMYCPMLKSVSTRFGSSSGAA